ncbi:hypothetical protein VQH23_05665 [Pararoseomonas sp. SCSIO 73927]|uniref:hypothetical protein n=1 Tax=Pararoseomonas sp. SCSIO 73927 TaxID=3114537 RepID=UPI0030D5751B
MSETRLCSPTASLLAAALLGLGPALALDADTEATLLKQSPLVVSAEAEAMPRMGSICWVLLVAAGRAGDAAVVRDEAHVAPAIRRCAGLPPSVLAGADGPPSERVASLLPGHRCMALVGGQAPARGGPTPLLEAPRPDSRRLGPATDPVIVADPLRIRNGHARALRRDGQPGWIRRDRLREWTVAASPGLRCLPARMADGSLGFTFAHPG